MAEKLLNLGPRSMEKLTEAGIQGLAEPRAMGCVQAYLKVRRIWKGASLNLLWALEGAVTGRNWREVAKHERLEWLTRLEAAQELVPPVRRPRSR